MKRRAGLGFREGQAVTDGAALEAMWTRAKEDLALVHRQGVIYGMYARKLPHVMVRPGATPAGSISSSSSVGRRRAWGSNTSCAPLAVHPPTTHTQPTHPTPPHTPQELEKGGGKRQ